jgi:hypothetical protein
MVASWVTQTLRQKTQKKKKVKTQKIAKEKKKSLNFLNLFCRTHITHAEMEHILFHLHKSVRL